MINRKSASTVAIVVLCLLVQSALCAQRREGQQTAENKSGKARVVVIGTGSPDIQWTTNVTTATLEDAIQQSGRFELITGAQRDKLLSEQGFNNSDLVDPKHATQVGKLLSARYIIIGNALDVTASTRKVPHSGLLNRVGVGGGEEVSSDVRAKVQIQMIDAQTGVVKLSHSYEEKVSKDSMTRSQGDSEKLREGYRTAMGRISVQFAREFGLSVPVEGLVVFAKGDRVAIDIGGEKAAQVGQAFEIYTEDEPIKNAAGEILSYSVTRYARIRVNKVEPKLSWVLVVETYDENGNRDPQPRLDRIKVNYSVKLVDSSGPR
jgi:hypothetical protein